jgi:hypothetical protein
MDVIFDHFYVVQFDFDTQNLTQSDIRDITRRYYDCVDWLKKNAKASYSICDKYMSIGIGVSFEDEQDCQNFMDFSSQGYPEFLYN